MLVLLSVERQDTMPAPLESSHASPTTIGVGRLRYHKDTVNAYSSIG